MTLPLATADKLAAKIAAELQPFCEQLDIAGSIRRRRPNVNDIDIVVLPKPGMFAALRDRVRATTATIKDGNQEIVVRLANGVQLDLWIAARPSVELFDSKPTNYGSLLLCRTGSVAHNIFLIEHAKRMGLCWNPHWGVMIERQTLASATEADIFKSLQLDFIPPERRER